MGEYQCGNKHIFILLVDLCSSNIHFFNFNFGFAIADSIGITINLLT